MKTYKIELWHQGWASDTWTIDVPEKVCAGGVDSVYEYMKEKKYQPTHFLISPTSRIVIESIEKLYKV